MDHHVSHGRTDRDAAPSLSEILDDPIVVALMRRDGISREHVQQLIKQVRDNLRARRAPIAA